MKIILFIALAILLQTANSRLSTIKHQLKSTKQFINPNQCNIKGFTFDSHITNTTVYSILLFLTKNKIQASNSLCQQFNMSKCDKICCEKSNKNYQQLRLICANKEENVNTPVNDTIRPGYTEMQLCAKTSREQCGQTCCISGKCDRRQNTNAKDNLRYIDQICIQDQQQEQMCNQMGLLWCDGECCGFSSDKHKCFSVNHFGTPYIRCPKE